MFKCNGLSCSVPTCEDYVCIEVDGVEAVHFKILTVVFNRDNRGRGF